MFLCWEGAGVSLSDPSQRMPHACWACWGMLGGYTWGEARGGRFVHAILQVLKEFHMTPNPHRDDTKTPLA